MAERTFAGLDPKTSIADTDYIPMWDSASAEARRTSPAAVRSLSHMFYVEGADPTGATSSTAQFQVAIDAAMAAGGGNVITGPGTFKLGALHKNDSISIYGAGVSATRFISDNVAAEYGYLYFSSGSQLPAAGQTIVGAVSSATAIVIGASVETGSWGGGDATGRLYCKTLTGAFSRNEAIDIQGGGSDVLTAKSVWKSGVFMLAGAKAQGDTTFTLERTTAGGGIHGVQFLGNNGKSTTDIRALRLSSYQKEITVTGGNGSAPVQDDCLVSVTSKLKAHILSVTASGGTWWSGTGTATLIVDFVEGMNLGTAYDGIVNDFTYPGEDAVFTASETLTFYSGSTGSASATATFGTQADAFDRDISAVDCSANAFGRKYLLEDVWITSMHAAAVTAQDERSLQIEDFLVEGCTFGISILKNHPWVGHGRFENNLFGLGGQNVYDAAYDGFKLTSNIYGIAGHSERPGLGVNVGRNNLGPDMFFTNRYYDFVGKEENKITGTRFISSYASVVANVVVSADDVAKKPMGPVSVCAFSATSATTHPQVAQLWLQGVADGPVFGNGFFVQGNLSVGIMVRNMSASQRGSMVSNNHFYMIGGTAIEGRVSTAAEGGGSGLSIYGTWTGNMIFSRDAATPQAYTIMFDNCGAGTMAVGATLEGATSGATATVLKIRPWRSGTYGASSAQGILIATVDSGTFTSGETVHYPSVAGSIGSFTMVSDPKKGEPAIILNGGEYGYILNNNNIYDQSTNGISLGFVTEELANVSIIGNRLGKCNGSLRLWDMTFQISKTNNVYDV